jgi:hypothetical protein
VIMQVKSHWIFFVPPHRLFGRRRRCHLALHSQKARQSVVAWPEPAVPEEVASRMRIWSICMIAQLGKVVP